VLGATVQRSPQIAGPAVHRTCRPAAPLLHRTIHEHLETCLAPAGHDKDLAANVPFHVPGRCRRQERMNAPRNTLQNCKLHSLAMLAEKNLPRRSYISPSVTACPTREP
jgi:hypothetical protein